MVWYRRSWIILSLLMTGILSCAKAKSNHELTALYLAMEHQNQSNPRQILIIGDSLTNYSDGFQLQEKLGSGYVVTHASVPGYDYRDWEYRMEEAFNEDDSVPDDIVVVLGTNDGYRYHNQTFTDNVNRFHERLRTFTSAHIYYSLVPHSEDPGLAESIAENNRLLEKLLEEDDRTFSNTEWIDLAGPFFDFKEKQLLYEADDPVHPSDTGYSLIGDTIKKALLP